MRNLRCGDHSDVTSRLSYRSSARALIANLGEDGGPPIEWGRLFDFPQIVGRLDYQRLFGKGARATSSKHFSVWGEEGGGLGANVEIEPDIASHTDVLTGSSRNHSSPTNVRGAGTRDEPLRMSAWEAIVGLT